ncbi:aminotransferase class I/II-fold pyridoxal phosphate-dependent enzyme [Paracoccus alkenifer]|uniref:Histidinol-phosphate aminotransferase n=1 Tax=Paracoccus alkenifer TaxID=65735 RepID=A0A1H6LR52_9RHOB|nr:aminotransferase class I/II-fold pyridoxal phosphate-dependent enzyme [Paracoccus alkenifer]SEH88849.1 histidinol-phosphate aminotransferase [Paracoccus alkenifer]
MTDHSLIRPEVAALPDYNAGLALERFRSVYGIDAVAKLDSNESPLGPSPAAVQAIREAAAGVGRYPDASDEALRRAIGLANGVEPEAVILGNGSEDLIGAIYRAVLRPGDRVVTICPSFGLHEFGALACGALVDKVSFPEDWEFPVDGLIAALRQPARVLIFSSPSNPAGPAVTQGDFARLLNAVPKRTLVVFDEAYREYLAPGVVFDALALLRDWGGPWLSLRTFSKAYGLAGARVGYGICADAALAKALRKTRNPFAINALAATSALAALQDDGHLARVVALTLSERARVADALAAKGYELAPSHGNFLFFRTPASAAELAEALRRKGVLIKAWQEEPFLDWARVTISSPSENDAFLAALPAKAAASSCRSAG